jgi:hypothetical protein
MPHEGIRGVEIPGRRGWRGETLESKRDALEALEKGFGVGHARDRLVLGHRGAGPPL